MPKKPGKELATVPVKVNYTPAEAELVRMAMEEDDEKKTGTWVKKMSLRMARLTSAERQALVRKSNPR